jgi:hypothetical protein
MACRGVYMLADFDEDQIEQFIQAWYDVLVKHGYKNS